MTRERAKELLPIIQAFAEGKEVEYFDEDLNRWREASTPCWGIDTKYRVKPEPREFWVNVYSNGDTYVHPSKDLADKSSASEMRIECIRVREVTEP